MRVIMVGRCINLKKFEKLLKTGKSCGKSYKISKIITMEVRGTRKGLNFDQSTTHVVLT